MGRCGDHVEFLRHPVWRPRSSLCCSMFCFALLVLANVSIAQLNHIEMAANLLSKGQIGQAEVEARQALGKPSTRALALAMLGTIRLQEANTVGGIGFQNEDRRAILRLFAPQPTVGTVTFFQAQPI